MKTIKERAHTLLAGETKYEDLIDFVYEIANAPEPAPVAHAVILPNGMTRIWFSDKERGEQWRKEEGIKQELTPLYTAPPANNQSEQHLERVNLPELKEGEIYAGIILNSDGAPSHHLILLPGDNDDANWADQTEWAKSIGGELPTRAEQSLLFANCKQHFQGNWYWSGDTVSSEPSWAWCQTFYYGYQISYHKRYALRARAVRRVRIK